MSFSSVVRARSTSASVTGSRPGPSSAASSARAPARARASFGSDGAEVRVARIAQHALVAPGRGWRGRSAPARDAGGRSARRRRRAPGCRSPDSRDGSPAGMRYSAATICTSPVRRSVTARSPSCVGSVGVERGQRARGPRDRRRNASPPARAPPPRRTCRRRSAARCRAGTRCGRRPAAARSAPISMSERKPMIGLP